MATGKRYYWIKLKESFMTSDAVDFLMGQTNGAQYVVLYQMLCLKTINTGGRLERHIGEVIIPYDEAKIQRDCKYFTVDTIRVALNLYKALGLVYTDNGGALCLTDYDNLVGSETDWADKRRRQRAEIATPGGLPGGDNVPTGVPSSVPTDVPQFVPTDIDIDIRDKEIEIRDESTEKKSKEKKSTKKADAFSAFAGDDEELLKALRDFERMRKDLGKPLTDRAKGMLVNKLKTFPAHEWVQILEQSIFHCWQGIFPLDRNRRGRASAQDPIDALRELHEMYSEDES